MKFWGVVSKLIVLLAVATAPAGAADLYGLLPGRDLSPFGFLRLDMRPAHAVSIEPGGWALETEFSSQNTWAMSPEVERYLAELEPSGRRQLGEAELAAIRDLPGENYLIDLEMTAVDVKLHYKFSPRLTGYLITTAVAFDGGFLDSTVEHFHQAVGLSSAGRPAVARDSINLVYDLKSTSYASLDVPSSKGLLDPTIGLRYSGIPLGHHWNVSFEAAVKLALDGKRAMLSTGRSDYGLQAAAQWRGERQAFYANVSAVYFSGGEFLVRHEAQVVPTLIVGYEYALTANTSLNVQSYTSTSMYSHRETDLPELLGNSYQITAGFRHRRDDVVISFGLTENVENINNTPDIGFQLGVAWLP